MGEDGACMFRAVGRCRIIQTVVKNRNNVIRNMYIGLQSVYAVSDEKKNRKQKTLSVYIMFR